MIPSDTIPGVPEMTEAMYGAVQTPTPAIYVRWSDDGQRIRKWSSRPFDGGIPYILEKANG